MEAPPPVRQARAAPGQRDFLNLARWLASFLVLVAHVRHLVLVDYKAVARPDAGDRALYFLTGLAPEAVVVFFVISGFLVGGVTWERWRAGGPQLAAYASARASRIYTAYVPALLLGAALDAIGLRWFNARELYTNPMQYHTIELNANFAAHLDLPTFLGNLLMAQNIWVARLGSNGPLWSLAYEWWCYVVFALAAAALLGRRGAGRVACAALALGIVALLPARVWVWGAIWALGIGARAWSASGLPRPGPRLGLAVFLAAAAASRLAHNTERAVDIDPQVQLAGYGRDLLLAMAFVLALVGASRMGRRLPWGAWHERMTRFTYTTYLCHFPLMLLAVAAADQVLGWGFQLQPGAAAVAYLFGLTACLWLCCYAIAQVTERRTASVRHRVDRWLQVRGAAD